MTEELMACTCPHHVHRDAFCKHMAAVENAPDGGTFDAFPSDDDHISGPHTGYDTYGNVDHNYWKCEKMWRGSHPAHSPTAANPSLFSILSRQTTLSRWMFL
ncbi:hypothetical protein [Haladaptatus sp. AB643]|uniref:hypothetical protein n=2 Tax=unclassified Haladaptatus TaxID=2622732 RepID=UPI00209BFFF0|nr:hypothetical protein [Haladaptatus sp. AB643]MCO8244679.1 hypothetical protein [Haladaptatus sp. AB643]